MSKNFGGFYADAYDAFYQDKDYIAECDVIEKIFNKFSKREINSILNLGCGTGNHDFPLVERGYSLTGVDRSESMIAAARNKITQNEKAVFHLGDIRAFHLDQKFDAALMMFAVLGYQLENNDVLAALKTARRHLDPGGLFVFDVWHGPAVLTERPSDRIKIIPTDTGRILRLSSGELDVQRHLCQVNYHVWQLDGDRLTAETEESHIMRYFFPQELKLFLELANFDLTRLGVFPNFDIDPDEKTWNVLGIAKAVK